MELRWPIHGDQRQRVALFGDDKGDPYSDSKFASYVKGAIAAVVGATRAKLYSCHSWRVWLASSLRMCNASDARIQAMGRWLSPDSVKIYSRMTTQEYATWVDRLMQVQRIDTARTTNLPIMDAASAFERWQVVSRQVKLGNGWARGQRTAELLPTPPGDLIRQVAQ